MMGQNNIGSKKVSVYFKTSLMSQIIHLEYNEKDCLITTLLNLGALREMVKFRVSARESCDKLRVAFTIVIAFAT